MKILQLCTKVPFPPKDGGAAGIYAFSKSLHKAGHEVQILAINPPKHFIDTSQYQNPDGIIIYPISVNTSFNLWSALINLVFSKIPYQIERFINLGFQKKLIGILQDFQPNIVQIEGVYLFFYLQAIRKFSDAKIVLRCHNIEHLLWGDIEKGERNIIKKCYLKIQNRRLKRFELKAFANIDGLTTVSEPDLRIITSHCAKTPKAYIPYGFPFDDTKYLRLQNNTNLFYIGALDWIPNRNALNWFIDNTWPLIQRNQPDTKIHIAGRNAPENLTDKLKNTKGVIFYGEIEDSSSFFASHSILIAPLFEGSGIRVKVIEAMFYGCVTVCTSKAIEGIPAIHGKHYIQAETATEFAYTIKEIYDGKYNLETMAKEAKTLANSNFNISRVTLKLVDFYKTLSND